MLNGQSCIEHQAKRGQRFDVNAAAIVCEFGNNAVVRPEGVVISQRAVRVVGPHAIGQ
jgi:hypothetical protein